MDHSVEQASDNFSEGIGQLFQSWGLQKSIGSVFALLYLREGPTSLEDIAAGLSMSKGNVSLNIREAERLGLVSKIWLKGDRRDYYEAEASLWKIVRRVSRERQKREFDFAVETVKESLEALPFKNKDTEVVFARKRLKALDSFLKSVNRMVNSVLSLETLRGATVNCPVLKHIPRKKRAVTE